MPRNIEIKARLLDRQAVEAKVAGLATSGPEHLTQDDTFFSCENGRLKLRALGQQDGRLIHYTRADESGPTLSEYAIASTSDPSALRDVLSRALRVAGRVQKRRTLYVVGRTRVHIDRVQGLGDFLELEVVLQDHENEQSARAEADGLLRRLGVPPEALVAQAYVDLLAAKGSAA